MNESLPFLFMNFKIEIHGGFVGIDFDVNYDQTGKYLHYWKKPSERFV